MNPSTIQDGLCTGRAAIGGGAGKFRVGREESRDPTRV